MKRAFAVLFSLLLVLAMVSPAAALQQEGNWTYLIVGGEAYIAAYSGTEQVMVIPDMLGGYPVTTISDDAIVGINALQTVYMPESVTSVGARNFVNSPNLTYVYLPAGLQFCGEGCFDGSSVQLQLFRGGVKIMLETLLNGVSGQAVPPIAEDAARRERALGYNFKDGVRLVFASSQTLPVYSGPGTDYYRAANGKAAVSTARAVYGTYYLQRHNAKWILIIYGTSAGASRYGWIEYQYSFGFDPTTYADVINSYNDRWFSDTATVRADTPLYDYTDPAMGAVTVLPAGSQVVYFALRSGLWAYIEATTELGLMRGFVDVNDLVF
jgi:hypothetical protein